MYKRREDKRIALKDKQWESDIDVFFDKLRVILPKWWRFIKREMKKAIKWYFCFQPKNNGDLALHIILWGIVTVGIVGWYRLAFGY